jgi:putative hydrolase of the HAD superfamily
MKQLSGTARFLINLRLPIPMDKIFIFDYDDTIAWTHVDYSLTEVKFLDFVLGRLGHQAPGTAIILNMLETVELKNVKTMGYSRERFPNSMRDVYRKICCQDKMMDLEGEEEAYRIGTGVFDPERWERRGLVEGAEETLDFLVAQNDKLMLLTKGDTTVQGDKIKATNIERWFGQDIYIVPEKNPQVFSELIDGYDRNKIWMVGNSEKSDIMPAIENGVKAIYIPYETWSVEEVKKGLPDSPLITRFEKIIEIKEKYDSLI